MNRAGKRTEHGTMFRALSFWSIYISLHPNNASVNLWGIEVCHQIGGGSFMKRPTCTIWLFLPPVSAYLGPGFGFATWLPSHRPFPVLSIFVILSLLFEQK